MVPPNQPGPVAGVRYGYFLLHTRASLEGEGAELTGVLEDLRTGEKHRFSGGEALARLLAECGAPNGIPP